MIDDKKLKKELEKSMINGITLMIKEGESYWAELFEIKEYLNKGYEIFNPIKKEIFEKKSKAIEKEIEKINKLNKMAN